MIDIVAKGLDKAISNMKGVQKQVAFANTVALTRTAKEVHARLTAEMPKVFDRPTPYVMRGLAWLGARKGSDEARVFARQFAGKGTPAEYILNPQVFGGQRRIKRFERALQGKGLMPPGWIAIPGPGAKFDAYGNINRGQIVQMLSALKAFSEQGYLMNRTNSRRSRKTADRNRYFVPARKQGAMPIGIYRHLGKHKNIPVILFKSAAQYRKRYPFIEMGKTMTRQIFDAEFSRAFAQAMATAR
jgi:hypothetical protein